jgi:branched-chain amino acid transport system substrate-binding protein
MPKIKHTYSKYKVGFLFSCSGVTSRQEQSQFRGAQQALNEINERGGINGEELVAIHYDPESNDDLFRHYAEKLILEDKVNVVFGGYRSSARKVILPIVEKYNKLLFYPQLYEGFEFSENIIYGGASPNQNCIQLAEFMVKNFGSRIYLVGSKYVYPYECNRNMREIIMQRHGGAVVGEKYLDLNASASDFEKVVLDIKRKCPDFIFSSVIGETITSLYSEYRYAGLCPKLMPIGSLNTSEVENSAMGTACCEGHYTASPYFHTISSKENAIAVSEFKVRYGTEYCTDMNWETAYYQVHLYSDACMRARSDDLHSLRCELLGSEFLAPQGRIKIDRRNQHTALYPRIGRANETGQFDILVESKERVSPDPYLTMFSLGDWSSRLLVTELSNGA